MKKEIKEETTFSWVFFIVGGGCSVYAIFKIMDIICFAGRGNLAQALGG